MVGVDGFDHERAHFHGFFFEVVKVHFGGHFVETNGKEGVREKFVHGLTEAFVEKGGSVEVEFVRGNEKGNEKGVADHMVVVGVAEDDVCLEGHLGYEGVAELSEARATVDDEDLSAFASDLVAGGVATVFNGVWAWGSDGAATAPNFDIHDGVSMKT